MRRQFVFYCCLALAFTLVLSDALSVDPPFQKGDFGLDINGFTKIIVFRLRPSADVLNSIEAIAQEHAIEAGVVLSAVGSLTQVSIRYANKTEATLITTDSEGNPSTFEIVSLSGTLEKNGNHIHLSASDDRGYTWGGHLMSGSRVYTTLELCVGVLADLTFQRKFDPVANNGSGYYELSILQSGSEASSASWQDVAVILLIVVNCIFCLFLAGLALNHWKKHGYSRL